MTLPADARVHRMIEAQIARTPDAVAVEFEGRSITYRELGIVRTASPGACANAACAAGSSRGSASNAESICSSGSSAS